MLIKQTKIDMKNKKDRVVKFNIFVVTENEVLEYHDYISKAMSAIKELDNEAEICAGSLNMNKFNEGIQYAIDLIESYRKHNHYGNLFPDVRLNQYIDQLKSNKE